RGGRVLELVRRRNELGSGRRRGRAPPGRGTGRARAAVFCAALRVGKVARELLIDSRAGKSEGHLLLAPPAWARDPSDDLGRIESENRFLPLAAPWRTARRKQARRHGVLGNGRSLGRVGR